ncbi:MAG: hypothetical protein J5766_03365, partial [Clostridia bacterium]|nr:hypothetical protein [Clostridia bacterium]
GKMTKTVKYVMILVLVSAMTGIFAVNFNLEFKTDNTASVVSDGQRDEKMITAVFENALKMNNVNFEKIIIFTDKTEEGSITITKIRVYSDEKIEKIVSAIGNGKAYEIEVVE